MRTKGRSLPLERPPIPSTWQISAVKWFEVTLSIAPAPRSRRASIRGPKPRATGRWTRELVRRVACVPHLHACVRKRTRMHIQSGNKVFGVFYSAERKLSVVCFPRFGSSVRQVISGEMLMSRLIGPGRGRIPSTRTGGGEQRRLSARVKVA